MLTQGRPSKTDQAQWLRDNCRMRGLESRDFQMLNEVCSSFRMHRGEFLFEEGERENTIFLIRSGKVALGHAAARHQWVNMGPFGEVDLDEDAGEPQWLEQVTLQPGECAGELNLFDQGPHELTAWVAEDGEVLSLNARSLRKVFETNPRLGACVCESLKQLAEKV